MSPTSVRVSDPALTTPKVSKQQESNSMDSCTPATEAETPDSAIIGGPSGATTDGLPPSNLGDGNNDTAVEMSDIQADLAEENAISMIETLANFGDHRTQRSSSTQTHTTNASQRSKLVGIDIINDTASLGSVGSGLTSDTRMTARRLTELLTKEAESMRALLHEAVANSTDQREIDQIKLLLGAKEQMLQLQQQQQNQHHAVLQDRSTAESIVSRDTRATRGSGRSGLSLVDAAEEAARKMAEATAAFASVGTDESLTKAATRPEVPAADVTLGIRRTTAMEQSLTTVEKMRRAEAEASASAFVKIENASEGDDDYVAVADFSAKKSKRSKQETWHEENAFPDSVTRYRMVMRRKRRRRKKMMIRIGAVVVLLGAIAYFFLGQGSVEPSIHGEGSDDTTLDPDAQFDSVEPKGQFDVTVPLDSEEVDVLVGDAEDSELPLNPAKAQLDGGNYLPSGRMHRTEEEIDLVHTEVQFLSNPCNRPFAHLLSVDCRAEARMNPMHQTVENLLDNMFQ